LIVIFVSPFASTISEHHLSQNEWRSAGLALAPNPFAVQRGFECRADFTRPPNPALVGIVAALCSAGFVRCEGRGASRGVKTGSRQEMEGQPETMYVFLCHYRSPYLARGLFPAPGFKYSSKRRLSQAANENKLSQNVTICNSQSRIAAVNSLSTTAVAVAPSRWHSAASA
jgi:hypothetical protein